MLTMPNRYIFKALWLLWCLQIPETTFAATFTVDSESSLNKAQDDSSPGDEIIWKDGSYNNQDIILNANGVTLRTETPGGVFLSGDFKFEIRGDDNVFSGFQIKRGNVGKRDLLRIYGDRNLVTQVNIDGFITKKYITISADSKNNDISYCNIAGKTMDYPGAVVQINTASNNIGYHHIHHCSFQDFNGPGGDAGNEPIRVGLSSQANNVTRSIIEYNYFNNVGPGDNESVSIKSSENLVRNNTFTNNPEGLLVFRHGSRNVASGNFFINNSGGIRIKEGQGHVVYNNYFGPESSSTYSLYLQNHDADPIEDITIIHNTFVNMGDIRLGKGSNAPKNVLFANNIFSRSSQNIFRDSTGKESWVGNIYQGDTGLGSESGLVENNPELFKNEHGYYSLQGNSPAIDKASDQYPKLLDIANIDDDPFLMLDFDGQPRPTDKKKKDVGADEYSSNPSHRRPLKLSDVGPSYLGGPPQDTAPDQPDGF